MLRVRPATSSPVSMLSSLAARRCTFRGKRISSKWIEWNEGRFCATDISPDGQDSIDVHNGESRQANESEPDIALHHEVNRPSEGLNQAAWIGQRTVLCPKGNIVLGAGPCGESIHESGCTDGEESPP